MLKVKLLVSRALQTCGCWGSGLLLRRSPKLSTVSGSASIHTLIISKHGFMDSHVVWILKIWGSLFRS